MLSAVSDDADLGKNLCTVSSGADRCEDAVWCQIEPDLVVEVVVMWFSAEYGVAS